MIKFLHYRNRRMVHYFSGVNLELEAKGGATIAFEKSQDGKSISVSVAKCPISQNFNKKIARDVSGGRLMKGKGIKVFDYDGSVGPTKFVQNLVLSGKIAIR